MRRQFWIGFVLSCGVAIGLGAEPPQTAPNPLIVRELPAIYNPGFEQGLVFSKLAAAQPAQERIDVPSQSFSFQTSTVAVEGKRSLLLERTSHGSCYIPLPTFTVPIRRRYYLTARIRTEGKISGALRPVAGAGNEDFSPWVGQNQDWTEVGVAFVGTEKHNTGLPPGDTEYDPQKTYVELRLETQGMGKVYFDDLRIFETTGYVPCLRLKLLTPSDQPYQVKFHGLIGPPNWYHEKLYFEAGVKPGEFSPWIELGSLKEFQGNQAHSAGLHILPLDKKPLERVKVELEFASAPYTSTPAADILHKTITMETTGNVLGVLIPSASVSPFEFARGVRPLAEDIRMRNEHIRGLNLPLVDLRHYYIEAHHKGFGSFFSDLDLLATELETIRKIGFSALDTQYSGQAGPYLKLADRFELNRTHQTTVGHIFVEDPATRFATFDEPALRARIKSYVDDWFANLNKADAAELPRVKFFVLCDEIWGVAFSGPGFEQAFRDYLKQQKITPDELGHASYDQITFPNTWAWHQTWDRRPKDRMKVAECREFYWKLRFWSYATAKAYALISEAIHRHYPDVPTVINHGAPWAYGYDGYMRGVEIFEFARQNATSAFLHEDWLNTSGWRHSGIQLCGYLADFSRSVGKVNHAPAYSYIMPASESQIQLKLATVVGKGIKVVDLYRYGPAYGSPDNWSQNLPQAAGVAKYLRQLDLAEDLLADAQPRPAQTAILWSASNDIWRETDATLYDQQLVYLALQHQQIPIDFVDEFAIEAGGLKSYKVAYMTSDFLRTAAQQSILKWVEGGGHLWLDASAGTSNEYGQQTQLFHQALGLKDVTIKRSEVLTYETQHGLPQQKALGSIVMPGSDQKIETIGEEVHFQLDDPANAEILAKYEDGSAAVIQRKYGKGTIYFVGTRAGCTYARPVVRVLGEVERGYREVERRLITDFAISHGVERPAACDIAGIQADVLEGPRGLGVVLANFSDGPQERIQLKIRTSKPIRAVRSVLHGPLKWKDSGAQEVTVELPLNLTDFVLVE